MAIHTKHVTLLHFINYSLSTNWASYQASYFSTFFRLITVMKLKACYMVLSTYHTVEFTFVGSIPFLVFSPLPLLYDADTSLLHILFDRPCVFRGLYVA